MMVSDNNLIIIPIWGIVIRSFSCAQLIIYHMNRCRTVYLQTTAVITSISLLLRGYSPPKLPASRDLNLIFSAAQPNHKSRPAVESTVVSAVPP